jgi:hypothetical protein
MAIIEEKCTECGGDIMEERMESGSRVVRVSYAYWCTTTGKVIGGHLSPNWKPAEQN